jgi:hypothetical protein
MPQDDVADLLRKGPLSFLGTVEYVGAATMAGVSIDDRTAVVQVVHVLHAPAVFTGLAGQRVTVQLSADTDPPAVGDTVAFFTRGLAYGESLVVEEAGRLPADRFDEQFTAAAETGVPATLDAVQQEILETDLREHASAADAVVTGRVVGLEKAAAGGLSEHDPDWWKATLSVPHVERGDVVPGEVAVLYANSQDVAWRRAPKPRASQEGVWLLHATEGDLREAAAYQILHPEDYQPVQQLDVLRAGED